MAWFLVEIPSTLFLSAVLIVSLACLNPTGQLDNIAPFIYGCLAIYWVYRAYHTGKTSYNDISSEIMEVRRLRSDSPELLAEESYFIVICYWSCIIPLLSVIYGIFLFIIIVVYDKISKPISREIYED